LNQRRRAALVFLAIVAIAAAFRFPQLAARPMHADEAVHASKLGDLLEQGRYEYSTVDYHGPTLYYLAIVAARAQGITHYADLNEVTLRAVPALFGVLLVAAHFLLIPYLGLPAAASAALFTAVSPAMVYYSRYFIHETLLVFFTFCFILALLGYFRRPGAAWAMTAGAMFGLMYATKETWILAVACMAGGVLCQRAAPRLRTPDVARRFRVVLFRQRARAARTGGQASTARPTSGLIPNSTTSGVRRLAATLRRRGIRHLILGAATAAAVAMLLMSSFLTHPQGIADSVLAFRSYFVKGSGVNTPHVHPWYFYINLLLYFHHAGAPVFSEALIAGLAVVGCAVSRGTVARFLAIYTVLLVAITCALPYKIPWNILGFWHGAILLAGIGTAWMWQHAPKPVVVALVGIGVAHLGWQARAASFQYGANPGNPWVYAHTGPDVSVIVKQMEALAAVSPAGHALKVQIVSKDNLWPLPWYLRRYSGAGWWNGVSDTAPLAPVILATPDMEPALLHRIYEVPPPGQREMYVNMFDRPVDLRPGLEIRGYVAKSLWDELP
jgi:uncharacterized protein (TIGR03663 family)